MLYSDGADFVIVTDLWYRTLGCDLCCRCEY